MSISSEEERLRVARNTIRSNLVALGAADGTETLSELAEKIVVLTKPQGLAGQYLGFTEDNVIGAVDAPENGEGMPEIIPIERGGTGNSDGYIRTGAKKGSVIGSNSTTEGVDTKAYNFAHAEGVRTQATGDYSHAEGFETDARGIRSHAEGNNTVATGDSTHSEGIRTCATGKGAHAEGFVGNNLDLDSDTVGIVASGIGSHAEGCILDPSSSKFSLGIIASGSGAHAGGYIPNDASPIKTIASGNGAYAHGCGVEANHTNSHASGRKISTLRNFEFVHGAKNTLSFSDSVAVTFDRMFGYSPYGYYYSEDVEPGAASNGISGTIGNTATVTLGLSAAAMYLLLCVSYTISTRAVYGATARLVVTSLGDIISRVAPTILSLGQTNNAPATISAGTTQGGLAAVKIKNGANTRGTSFVLIRLS